MIRRPWKTILACAALILGAAASIAQATDEPKPEAAAPEEKIVFTFQNDDQMKTFQELWQQRQMAAVRMTVLQSYWDEEQVKLKEFNDRLVKEYQVDASKGYSMDRQRKLLIERPEAPAAPADPASPIPPVLTPN